MCVSEQPCKHKSNQINEIKCTLIGGKSVFQPEWWQSAPESRARNRISIRRRRVRKERTGQKIDFCKRRHKMPEKKRISNYFFIYLNFVRRRNEAQPQNMPHKFALGTCNFCRTAQGRSNFQANSYAYPAARDYVEPARAGEGRIFWLLFVGTVKAKTLGPHSEAPPKKNMDTGHQIRQGQHSSSGPLPVPFPVPVPGSGFYYNVRP